MEKMKDVLHCKREPSYPERSILNIVISAQCYNPGQTRKKQTIPGQNTKQNSHERQAVLGCQTESKVTF